MEQSQNQAPGEEELLSIDFRRYLGAIRKYKWIIAAIFALSITGAVLYTSQLTNVYQATGSIKIDPRLPDLLGQGQEMMSVGAGGNSSAAEYYRQQRKVLESYQLTRRTVADKQLHLHLVSESDRAGLTEEEAMDKATRKLRDDMSIGYPEQNRIMLVTVRNPDSDLAAEIANAHIDTYVAWTKGELSTGTQHASKWLTKELQAAETGLRSAETELIEFQKDNDILSVSLEDRQNMVSSNIARYTQSLNDARAKRIQLKALLTRIKESNSVDVLESPVFGLTSGAALEGIKSQYYLERNRFLEIEKELGPKNIEYRKQKAKVDDLRAALENESRLAVRTVEEQLKAAAATEGAFSAELKRYRDEAFQLGPKVVEYNQLLRDKKSSEDRYNMLVGRLGTSDLSSRIDTINVKPLDKARPSPDAIYPSMRRNVAAAGAMSLFLGIGLAFLLAFLDRSIKSVEDAQNAANAPVLGIIPVLAESELPQDDDKARDLYVFKNPTSRVAECCRSLRTNILFSGADRPLKTLVVSSPNPREGKTTTVIYLGTTMAQSGQRVLLIDTDMRRPRLHQSTGVSRNTGLSNLIVGDADYDDVIKTTDIPNLFVLPCGPLPPNPAELLMTKRFETVLRALEERFDRILLDSPPLQAVTDAVVLSKCTDGVVLVVKAGKTLRDDVTRSVRQITDVGGAPVGVIVNELDMEERRGYYVYSYYGYGKEGQPEPVS